MLETRAIVVRTDPQQAWVEAVRDSSGCGQCQGKGCGSSKLSQLFCSQSERLFRVENPIAAESGDQVVIAVADGTIWQGVLHIYLLPLLLLFVGGLTGSGLAQTAVQRDGAAAAGALIGLCLGLIWAWRRQRHHPATRRAYIARRWTETG